MLRTFIYLPSSLKTHTSQEKIDINILNGNQINLIFVFKATYFFRPIIPFLQQVPPDVVLEQQQPQQQPASDDLVTIDAGDAMHSFSPLTRTVGVQTLYR